MFEFNESELHPRYSAFAAESELEEMCEGAGVDLNSLGEWAKDKLTTLPKWAAVEMLARIKEEEGEDDLD